MININPVKIQVRRVLQKKYHLKNQIISSWLQQVIVFQHLLSKIKKQVKQIYILQDGPKMAEVVSMIKGNSTLRICLKMKII